HGHSPHVGTPGGDVSIAVLAREHHDADAEQHRKNRDELPVSEQRRKEPDPPVQPLEVPIGRRVPAADAGKGNQLSVDRQHTEYADTPKHVERSNPRRPLHRYPAHTWAVFSSRAHDASERGADKYFRSESKGGSAPLRDSRVARSTRSLTVRAGSVNAG